MERGSVCIGEVTNGARIQYWFVVDVVAVFTLCTCKQSCADPCLVPMTTLILAVQTF